MEFTTAEEIERFLDETVERLELAELASGDQQPSRQEKSAS